MYLMRNDEVNFILEDADMENAKIITHRKNAF